MYRISDPQFYWVYLSWMIYSVIVSVTPHQCNAERVISSSFWGSFYSQVLLITVLISVLVFNLQCRFAKQSRSLFFNKKEAAKRKKWFKCFQYVEGFLESTWGTIPLLRTNESCDRWSKVTLKRYCLLSETICRTCLGFKKGGKTVFSHQLAIEEPFRSPKEQWTVL